MSWSFRHTLLVLSGAAVLTGCGLIDDDLSDCETECDLHYEVRLVTNMAAEIRSRLGEEADAPVASALRERMQDVFSDDARDIDLDFYDVIRGEAAGDSLRRHHGRHMLSGSEGRFSFYLPAQEYMHLAVANLAEHDPVTLTEDEACHAVRLAQEVRDTVPSHPSALFTARLPMRVHETGPEHFNATLYMVNCATALIIDTLGSHVRKLEAYTSGFATGFQVCDSVYTFDNKPFTKAERLEFPGTESVGFFTVNFPSPDTRTGTRTVIDTEAPFVSDPGTKPLWNYWLYATLPDGTVTRNQLLVYNPLRAGQLRILRVRLYPNGSVEDPGEPTVGLSVTLDWNQGMDHNITI